MDRTETKKIIMELKALYPTLKFESDAVAINAWSVALRDYNFHDVELVINYYLTTNDSGFPPSVNQLITAVRKMMHPESEELAPAEAWAQVYKVATETPYHKIADAYKKLPKATKKALGSSQALMEIATMDINDAVTVSRSNFLRMYQSAKKIEREEEMLPPGLKKAIADRRESGLEGTSRSMIEDVAASLPEPDKEDER